MATKAHVQISYDADSASDTTYDEESVDGDAIMADLTVNASTKTKDGAESDGASDTSLASDDDDEDNDMNSLNDKEGENVEVKREHDEEEDSGDDSGDEADADDEDHSDDDSDDDSATKSGLANVMAKILEKKTKANKPVILARAKTDREIQWKKRQAELSVEAEKDAVIKKKKTDSDADDEPVHQTKLQQERERLMKRKFWEEKCHVKPSVLDRDVERKLQRIATRGVVQLFNAVKKQQKLIEDKLKEVGSSERKRDQVMKSVTKGAFLDMLKGANASNVSSEPTKELDDRLRQKSTEDDYDGSDEDAEKPSWSILRDDFMMGAKMKDWDKKEEDDSDDDMDGDNPGGGGRGGGKELDSDSD